MPIPAQRLVPQFSENVHPIRTIPSIEAFSDARTHGYRGPSRSVTLSNTSSPGGSAISRSQDCERCVVAGKDSLRILRVSGPSEKPPAEHRFAIGKGGHAIDASRNLWSGSGLQVDSAMTDVVWCHKGSDLRDLSRASHYIHHISSIRTAIALTDPLHAVTGLDNGTMCRWDLRMGQKGQLERIPLAHTGPILSLDWRDPGSATGGWLASAGYDRTVKVWDFSDNNTNTAHLLTRKPEYVLHASYPVRRVAWRPGYETELAIASNNESGFDLSSKISPSSSIIIPSLNNEIPEAMSAQITSGGRNTNLASPTLGGRDTVTSAGWNAIVKSGDMIEIWDVRREWIAKWVVGSSNCEGGVSDMTFADSHALWVQHPSGAFSQMDLRYSDKPVDSVPRTALTWTPTGSLTFVNDSPARWEIPYDDIVPAPKASSPSEMVESHKKLGDDPYIPTTQSLGTLFDAAESNDLDVFDFLARGYRIEGADQQILCEINSGVAFNAGNDEAGRIWLLLRSLLTDIVVTKLPTPALSSKASAPTFTHSISALAGIPTVKKSPIKYPQTRSSSSDMPKSALKASPRRDQEEHSERVVRTNITMQLPILPAISQSASGHGNSRRSASPDEAFDMRRQSVSVASLARTRRQSLRHSSTSTTHPDDKSSSSRTRRMSQIGEGALDDSDSSETRARDRHATEMKAKKSADALKSPSTSSLRHQHVPQRNASSSDLPEDNDWAEDEKEESVSPDSSSGAESDNSIASTTAARSSSLKRTTRSRSSTLASIAANPVEDPRNITRTDSHSSVLTVTAAGNKSVSHDASTIHKAAADRVSAAHSFKGPRRHSQVFSMAGAHPQPEKESESMDEDEMRFLEWNHMNIKDTEERYRTAAWEVVKIILEELADSGNVQLCAMLACIAPDELGISTWRALQFVEAYIELLSRLRMHTIAAYIRKYAPSSEVGQSTQIQTTIATVCASCRKPIVQSATGETHSSGRAWKGFSQCFDCKKVAIKCSIWWEFSHNVVYNYLNNVSVIRRSDLHSSFVLYARTEGTESATIATTRSGP
ncbi:hypothetical protein EW145_g102 [Phellinidium pouzarii]|uniref:Uncharacterized protein n=1 Tax=Phellinidium pouzarii TaxID=167371 RepID=A0A4S4LJQ9_9AGAM|nr:hypothetical protein EW145_g102 [Phellinidium pouzarii]